MDDIANRYFNDVEAYGKAMELLMRYEQVSKLDWNEAEKVLMDMDDYDEHLLSKAIEMRLEENNIRSSIAAENARYIQIIQMLQGHGKQQPYPIPPEPTFTEEENPYLDEVIEKWLDAKSKTAKPSSLQEYENKGKMFSRILTEYNEGKNPRIAEISGTMIRNYKDRLAELPPNPNKGSKAGKTIRELVARVKAEELKPISQSSVYNTCKMVSELFKWAEDEQYPVKEGTRKLLANIKKPKQRDRKQRIPFTPENLQSLFQSEQYQHGTFKRASDYWVPLLGLFTGARLAELVQLYVSDIYKMNDVWVIDINDNDDKELKSEEGSPRIIPIHPTLIDLGFIKYVKHQEKNRVIKLFPCESRNTRGKFGAFSNRFQNYRKKVDVVPSDDKTMVDFHSFRHLVRTALKDKSIAEDLIDDIIGHSSSIRSIGNTVYTHTQLIKQKHSAISKLRYNIELSELENWKNCLFIRQPFREKAAANLR